MPRKTEKPLPLTPEQAQRVTVNLNQAYSKIDQALLQALQTTADLVKVGMSMGLDPRSAQSIFADMGRCTDALIGGRERLIAAHERAHRVRMRSTAAGEQMFGCPRATARPTMEDGSANVVALPAVA